MARDNWLNKKIQVRPRFLLLLAIPVLLLVLAICKANARIGELQTQVDRAQEQVLAAYSETEELQRKLEFMDTDEYIEQEARKRYNLLGDREIRFVLGTENSDNTEKLLQGIKPETEKYDDVGDDTLEQPVPTAAPAGGN
ncbi:MAG: septum formation initiator family protein [Clostridiales bacterium]|nr:septum formation initiator family protein [Clostridiales bacterium]MDY2835333.1 septum formation initiator family protein [Candidatus Aphodomonas sp.]